MFRFYIQLQGDYYCVSEHLARNEATVIIRAILRQHNKPRPAFVLTYEPPLARPQPARSTASHSLAKFSPLYLRITASSVMTIRPERTSEAPRSAKRITCVRFAFHLLPHLIPMPHSQCHNPNARTPLQNHQQIVTYIDWTSLL